MMLHKSLKLQLKYHDLCKDKVTILICGEK